jgi:hypothetical protein
MNYPYFLNRLFLWSVLLLLLHACKKPDTSDNNEYVVQDVYINGKKTYSYNYNDKWQMTRSAYTYSVSSRMSATEQVDYFYNSDGRLERTETVNYNIGLSSHRAEYTYDSQGQLTLYKDYFKSTGELYFMDEYSYNGQTIIRTRTSSSSVQVNTYTLDDRGNIVKVVTDNTGPGAIDYSEEWLDYDDKVNIIGMPGVGDVTSKNNYRRYIKQEAGQSAVETLIGLTYNNAGYVIERKIIGAKGGNMSGVKYVLIPKQ